jgi:hypothetical protein
MPIRITLSDNEIYEVDISLDEWNRAFQQALQGSTMLEIQEPSGHILGLNPHRVVRVETVEPVEGQQAAQVQNREAQPA